MSGMSPGFLGLWDGMDSGIRALHSGTLGTMSTMFLGFPGLWTVGLEPSTVGQVWDVPELLGTLGCDGQWDWSHLK